MKGIKTEQIEDKRRKIKRILLGRFCWSCIKMYKGEKPYKVLQKNLARKDNMTYEQAKELKDAGLKQKHGKGTRFIYPDGSLEIAASDQDKQ